jgi:hypothetical protein
MLKFLTLYLTSDIFLDPFFDRAGFHFPVGLDFGLLSESLRSLCMFRPMLQHDGWPTGLGGFLGGFQAWHLGAVKVYHGLLLMLTTWLGRYTNGIIGRISRKGPASSLQDLLRWAGTSTDLRTK